MPLIASGKVRGVLTKTVTRKADGVEVDVHTLVLDDGEGQYLTYVKLTKANPPSAFKVGEAVSVPVFANRFGELVTK